MHSPACRLERPRRQQPEQAGYLVCHLHQRLARRTDEPLAGSVVKEPEEAVPVAAGVQQDAGFLVQSKHRPGHDFAELIQSAQAARECHKRAGKLCHQCFPFVHGRDDVQSRQTGVRYFTIHQRLRDDAGYLAAGSHGCVGNGAHQADTRTSIDKPIAIFGKNSAQHGRLFGVGWADPFGGTAEDADITTRGDCCIHDGGFVETLLKGTRRVCATVQEDYRMQTQLGTQVRTAALVTVLSRGNATCVSPHPQLFQCVARSIPATVRMPRMEMSISMHADGRGHALTDRNAYPGFEAPMLQMGSFEDASQGRPDAVTATVPANASLPADQRSDRETALHFLQGIITAIAVILLLACLSKAHGESYSFRNYQQTEGLQNPNISNLLQDHSGLLWMGTENGLYKFDGGRINRIQTFENRDLPSIKALNVDAANRLWVSSYHELIYLDAQGQHRLGLPRYGTRKNVTTALASFAAQRDQVFLLAESVLYRIASTDGGTTWKQTPLLTAAQVEEHPELRSIDSLYGAESKTDGDRLWASCTNKLCEISPGDGTVKVWGPSDGVPDDEWDTIFLDHAGNVWARGSKYIVSLPEGATRFVSEQGSLTAKSLNMRQSSIAEDPQGRILTNVNNGIARRDGKDWRVFGTEHGLSPHPAYDLLFDRQGSFWFAVGGHGLERWLGYDNWENWTSRNGLPTGALWGLEEDHQKTMWVTNELDASHLPPGSDRWQPLDASHPVRQAQALLVDTRGHIWIGRAAAGAVIDYDPVYHRTRTVTSSLAGVYNLFEDPAGSIWLLATKGLGRLDPDDGYTTLKTTIDGHAFPPGGFSEAKVGRDGFLYFIGDQGLFQLQRGSGKGFVLVTLPKGITIPYNSPVAVAKDGTIWLQGEASPLVHLRVNQEPSGPVAVLIERVTEPSVASPSVYILAFDHRGWLWVGSDRGMDVFNGTQWVGLTTDDGLVWNDTDSDSFHESSDGSVWIGTSGGLSHILHPERVFQQQPIALLVTKIELGNEPISLAGTTRVAWSRRGALAMTLGVSNPARASQVRYRYHLEGLENEWQESDEPTVRYAALPPGKYRLAVMAVDARRHQESAPVYIDFRLLPPWWRTAWFLCGLAITIAALVGLASWWRVKALVAQQQQLEELVRERTYQLELEKKELIEARTALVEQASRDGLTGLLNRSAIFEILANEIQYASEKDTPLAIVLADLDHFKRINDTYGHQIGDAVLRECARRFRQATRPTDYVGRYGGEELLLIMPGLTMDSSIDRLENLRATIAHELFDCEGIGLPVTCSFGVAWLDEQSRGIKPLIALADQALYAAKTRGRNRVETISSATSGLFFPDGSGPLLTV